MNNDDFGKKRSQSRRQRSNGDSDDVILDLISDEAETINSSSLSRSKEEDKGEDKTFE